MTQTKKQNIKRLPIIRHGRSFLCFEYLSAIRISKTQSFKTTRVVTPATTLARRVKRPVLSGFTQKRYTEPFRHLPLFKRKFCMAWVRVKCFEGRLKILTEKAGDFLRDIYDLENPFFSPTRTAILKINGRKFWLGWVLMSLEFGGGAIIHTCTAKIQNKI